MINQNLHKQPTALDSAAHRNLKLKLPLTDWRVGDKLNAMFVAAAEFGEVCREFPIVFVKAGKEPDGSDAIAPIAVFGLVEGENLYLAGERWRAQYMPAVLRAYPFCIARVDEARFAICVDTAWPGTSVLEGQPLFTEDGEQAPLLKEMSAHLETLEAEIQRTSPAELRDLPDTLWQHARVVTPVAKQAISIRLDRDVLDFFRATGPRYQSQINAVLRSYVDHVVAATPPTRRKRAV